MRMERKSVRGELFGKGEQSRAPALTPCAWIDREPVNIRPMHGEIGDAVLIERADPDCACGSYNIVEDTLRRFNGQRLPCWKRGVRRSS
jgi:hypothetical protein